MEEQAPIDIVIQQIPKAELHRHLVGSIPPSLLLDLAEQNGVELPFNTIAEARAAREFDTLSEFIDFFYTAASVLRQPADFTDVVVSLAAASAEQNIRYQEVTFSYGYYDGAVDWDDVIAGLAEGRRRAAEEYDVTLQFVAGLVRTNDPETTTAVVERAARSPQEAGITTIGMGGKEVGNPAHRHREAYDYARELDFHRVVHAGEAAGPSSIWDALCSLEVERIDHGVRAIEDDILCEYLATEEIPLTVCPVSNVELNVFERMRDHPVCELIDAGIPVSIHSDDPALFGANLVDNYRAVATAFDLTPADVEQLARNSFKHSFLSATEQKQNLTEIDTVMEELRASIPALES